MLSIWVISRDQFSKRQLKSQHFQLEYRPHTGINWALAFKKPEPLQPPYTPPHVGTLMSFLITNVPFCYASQVPFGLEIPCLPRNQNFFAPSLIVRYKTKNLSGYGKAWETTALTALSYTI